jgi:hypothetical protein
MDWNNENLYKYFLTNEKKIRIMSRQNNNMNMNETVGMINATIIDNKPLFKVLMQNSSMDGDVEAHIKFQDDELQRKLDNFKNTENGISILQKWLSNERREEQERQRRERQRRFEESNQGQGQGQGGRRRKSLRKKKSLRKRKSMRRKSMKRKC